MALPIRKLIVKLRMFWADIRGHHGKRWDYEPIVVMKKNNHKTLVVLDAEKFVKLCQELNLSK